MQRICKDIKKNPIEIISVSLHLYLNIMKLTRLFTLILATLLLSPIANAQVFQLPNADFESWDGTTLTGNNASEPTHWNTFCSSDGSYASMASSNHHAHRHGGRPGTTGSSFLTIWTKSILGIKANGNMTTGRIHAGAMSASSSSNYNYTQRSNSNHSCPFTGTPDSMYVWVSYYAASASSVGAITSYIHGDYDFVDPNDWTDTSKYCGYAKARFTPTTTSATTYNWQQIKVPFTYDGNAPALYNLMSITTNQTPGSGSANDSLSIDDIEFIYSAWLNGIAINGTPIMPFSKSNFEYTFDGFVDTSFHGISILCSREASDATVTIDSVDFVEEERQGRHYSIHVVAEDQVTMRDYHIYCIVTPTERETPQYRVVVHSADSTMGNVIGSGVYPEGTIIEIQALPNEGKFFTQWNDGDTSNPRSITLTCDTSFTAYFDQEESIEDVLTTKLHIYPNPTSGIITIETASQEPIQLLDLLGHQLISIRPQDAGTHINLSPYPAGTYILRQGNRHQHIIKRD